MTRLFLSLCSLLILARGACAAEQSMLARVTVYWHNEGSGEHASWNGAKLRAGHCAVDPRKIPFGSKVVFSDATCVAVDTGPAVVSRKAARACARNASERTALVIDRFFETKEQALRWEHAHPHFMTVRVVTADSYRSQKRARASLDQPARLLGTRGRVPFRTGCDVQTMFDSAPVAMIGQSTTLQLRTARRRG
jgi:3D (Asp-Asp-Asp) domain-containing protein